MTALTVPGAVARARAGAALPCVVVIVSGCASSIGRKPRATIQGAIASSLLLIAGILGLSVALIYGAVRCSTTITLIGGEGLGLRAAVRRSFALSRGRRMRIALLLLTATVLAGLVLTPLSIVSVMLLLQEGDLSVPLVALAGAVYVPLRVLAAPILPLMLVVLRDDLVRLAAPSIGTE